MRQKPDYDQLLKRLLLDAHDGFLALIAPDTRWRGELPQELPAPGRRADLVWQVEQADGAPEILHVELQTKVERDIGERMADYALRLYRQHHHEVRSLVLYLRASSALPAPVLSLSRQGTEYLPFYL